MTPIITSTRIVLVMLASVLLCLGAQSKSSPAKNGHPEHKDTLRLLGSPYYSIEDHLKATLMLSNQGPHEMPITVSLFSTSGERFDAPRFTLQGNEVKSIDVQDWIDLAGSMFREGSLQVSFSGKRLELGGLVTLVDDVHSLVFEQELNEPAKDFRSSALEGVWWLPSEECTVRLVVLNTSDSRARATVTVGQQRSEHLMLKAHETRILTLENAFWKDERRLSKVGGVSVQYIGDPGAVSAVGFIREPKTGYSNVIEFADPQTMKASRLDGAGLRIGTVAGEELIQRAVVRNVGSTPTTVKGQIPYTLTNGTMAAAVLQELSLLPGESKEVDLHHAVLQIPGRENITAAGLEFTYNTAPGAIIASAVSLSPSGTQVFRLPLKDPNVQSSSTGNYPWSIDENSSTVVYIKNTTDSAKRFTMYVASSGTSYVVGAKTIDAHQTLAFDLRQIREDHVPDAHGQEMPTMASNGQVHWSLQGPEPKTLVGRAEQSNLAAGLSTTSSCGACCGDSFNNAFLTPDSLTGIAGDSASLEGYEQDISCYGSLLDYYPRTPTWDTWQCDNTSVAAVDQNGTATAQGFGNTYIRDLFFAATYYADAGDECHENDFTAEADASCDVFYDASPTCTINVRASGDKSGDDTLSFGTGDNTLGFKVYPDRWALQTEIGGTVSDDASLWELHQSVSGVLRVTQTQQFSTPNDDPIPRYTQRIPGAQTYYWIDAPGYNRDGSGGPQNMRLVMNFISWAKQGNAICRTTWHNELVVVNGLTQSYFGLGFTSTK